MLATLYQYRKSRSQVVYEKAAACEFCDLFQNSFSAEHCQTTASVSNILNHQITNLKLEVYYKITIGCLSEECMDVDWRGGRGGRFVRCDQSPPPFECFALLISYKNFIILLNFFNETITLFLKQLEPNSIINGYSNVINGNKTIKSYEFCVKILHQECREVAQKLWFW